MWIEVCDVEDDNGECVVDFSKYTHKEKQEIIDKIVEGKQYFFRDVFIRTGCVDVEVDLHE